MPATQASAPAQARTPAESSGWRYVAPDAVDFKALLPKPLDEASPEARAFEQRLSMAMKSLATPAAQQRARKDEGTTLWMFAGALSSEGFDFTPERFPRIAATLRQASADADRIKNLAKDHFARERPNTGGDAPRMAGPEAYSYPSGHAVRAAVHARLLAEVVPDREIELLREAWFYGHSRLARGAHFPSDIVAGFVLGEAIADAMLKSPALQSDLAAAREEWQALNAKR